MVHNKFRMHTDCMTKPNQSTDQVCHLSDKTNTGLCPIRPHSDCMTKPNQTMDQVFPFSNKTNTGLSLIRPHSDCMTKPNQSMDQVCHFSDKTKHWTMSYPCLPADPFLTTPVSRWGTISITHRPAAFFFSPCF